jgi:hypothetical protein
MKLNSNISNKQLNTLIWSWPATILEYKQDIHIIPYTNFRITYQMDCLLPARSLAHLPIPPPPPRLPCMTPAKAQY